MFNKPKTQNLKPANLRQETRYYLIYKIMFSSKKYTMRYVNEIASEKGGECLSTNYKDHTTPLQWECARGHKFETSFQEVKRDNRCPNCSDNEKKKKYNEKKKTINQQ